MAGNSNSIVVTPLQYDLRFNEVGSWHLPLTIYSAEISSSADPDDANQAKLLDPEQGLLNATFSGIGKFRLGEFCNFSSTYGCYVSTQGAIRYTRFRTVEDSQENTGTDANAIGALAKIGLSFVFPIYELSDSIAGHLALSGAYTAYYQNLSDSTILFSDALDSDGNPLTFDKSYQAWNVNAELAITNKLGLKLKYFDPIDSDILEQTFAVEFTYDVQ